MMLKLNRGTNINIINGALHTQGHGELFFMPFLFDEMARERIFRFKHFDVINDKTAMKVGTDGVLLGAWCSVEHATRVLDVGTGCGLIALMIAQRNPLAFITAIDIDCNAIEEARQNFENSAWRSRLQAQCIDFNHYSEKGDKFDLIVSNPPFFNAGILPPEESRKLARHTTALTFTQLMEKAQRLLNQDGILSIISPIESHKEIVESCVSFNLYINKLTEVIPTENSTPKRLLWEISPTPQICNRNTLTIATQPMTYTQEYRNLCKDFYLKF